MKKRNYFAIALVAAALLFSFAHQSMGVKALGTGCASGSPASGAYTVTVCVTAPANGSTLSGDQTVTGTVSVTGTNASVQRLVFNLNGAYLLTDYGTPYTFTLTTTKWVDGIYQLSVNAVMRDGYSSPQGSISVTFNNGITTPPVNTNQFQPSTGIPPANGKPFLVAATGDGASGQTTSSQVISLISSLNPNLLLYLGDVYEKGSLMEFYNWYGVTTNFGSLRAITDPTIGNHEYQSSSTAQGYFDYWNNVPNYYSFNAGGWHFISLNSNSTSIAVGPSSAQYKWLQQDLAGNALPCTIVFYHEPLFNIGPEGARTSMSYIWSLLAQNGVPIVLNGHDHDYQRWVPLDGNGLPSPTGVTEFVAGGGGHGLQTLSKTDSRVAYSNDTNPAVFGTLLLQLNSASADFSYHSINGTILDSGTIACPKAGSNPTPTPTPTTNPSPTPTTTLAFTNTPTFTPSPTSIPTATWTPTPTLSVSTTPTNTPTMTNTPTATSSGGGMFTFTPSADAYVDSSNPTANFGTATTLRIDGSPTVNTYLKFTVSGLTGTVTQATLRIFANSSGGLGLKANGVADSSWGETTLNFNNAPGLGSVLGTSAAFSGGSWVSVDLTGYVSGNGTYSVGITDPSATAVSLAAREAGANAAQLIIVTH